MGSKVCCEASQLFSATTISHSQISLKQKFNGLPEVERLDLYGQAIGHFMLIERGLLTGCFLLLEQGLAEQLAKVASQPFLGKLIYLIKALANV